MFNHNQRLIKNSQNVCLQSSKIDERFQLDHSFVCRNTKDRGPLLIIFSVSESTKKAGNVSMYKYQIQKKEIFYLKYDSL